MHVFFVVKLTELQHLNQHVHLFAKKSTISALRVYLANSSGHNLDIWGVDSNFLVRTASTSCDLLAPFWLKDMTTFFWGGKLLAPTVDVHQPCLLTTRLPRRQKNWTRNQGTYQMFSGSFDGTTSTGSCFLPNKKPFAMRNLEFMISRDKNIMRGWLTPRSRSSHHFLPQDVVSFGSQKENSFIKAKLPLNP